MLNKLLKHEFIATGRIMGAVYAVVALLMAYIMGSYYIGRDTASTGQMIGISVLILISACNFILTAVVMVMNFQRSLYGDQGYLSFTLPVKSVSLLTSKVIVSTVWFVAALLCLFGTVMVSANVIRSDVIGEDTFSMLESLLPMLLGGKTVATVVTTVVVYALTYFVNFAMLTIELYFAITLANTRHFQKNHNLWSIVFILAIFGLSNGLSELIANQIDFGIAISDKSISLITDYSQVLVGSGYINLVSLITSVIIGAAFFYGTFYLMSKKVNIR